MAVQIGNSYVSQEAYNYARARVDSLSSQEGEKSNVLSDLMKQYPNTNFAVGTQPFGGKGNNNISIAPNILRKMENDPQARLEYEALIYDCASLLEKEPADHGDFKTVARGFIINADGSLGMWGITQSGGGEKNRVQKKVSKDELEERLEKLREKKAEEKKEEEKRAKKAEEKEELAATYEKSEDSEMQATYSVNKMSPEERAALVSKLKDDQEARQKSLIDLVKKMFGKQAKTYGAAQDSSVQEQAKKDIGEDGYWGVKQTSQRLFDFASALAGDDVDKMHEMQRAMEKGFKLAARSWGGKLPDICGATLEAANKLFENYYESKKQS